jgi:hypothetical protein
MTYQQYYNKLIKDIAEAKKHLSQQNKQLKGEKGYLDARDMYAYMSLQNDFNSLAARAEEISKLLTSGDIGAKDQVDLARYPGAIQEN